MLLSSLYQPAIRNDSAGSGLFLAPRNNRTHMGMDFYAPPGQAIHVKHDVEFTKRGRAYSATDEFVYLEFQDGDIYIRYFYVDGTLIKGKVYRTGEQIGIAQNVANYYQNGMQNHVHFECFFKGEVQVPGVDTAYHQRKDRTYVNPLDYLNEKI